MAIEQNRIEAAKRAIAAMNGDDFDAIPADKREWTEKAGQFGGRFRGVNEPTKTDYHYMAVAAAQALFPELASDPPTGWVAPWEATEAMEDVADAVALDRADRGWAPNGGGKWVYAAMRDAHLKEQGHA